VRQRHLAQLAGGDVAEDVAIEMHRGQKPRFGVKGVRPGGRQKGTPNRFPPEIKALAAQYGPEAIDEIVTLMRRSKSEDISLRAADMLLMRAYGRPQLDVSIFVKREVDDFSDAELALLVDDGHGTPPAPVDLPFTGLKQ
jgi:hypothetical protein